MNVLGRDHLWSLGITPFERYPGQHHFHSPKKLLQLHQEQPATLPHKQLQRVVYVMQICSESNESI
eukprot:2113512-Amphidinium_carterae.1